MMTDAELQAIRERCEKATPGPWEAVPGGLYQNPKYPGIQHRADIQTEWSNQKTFKSGPRTGEPNGKPKREMVCMGFLMPCADLPDADFIAHARTDIPALLAEVDRLRADVPVWVGEPEVDGAGPAGPLPLLP